MRQLKIEYLETDKLIPYINNPRINDNAVDAVAGSIAEFGFKNPIIVDRNNVIIAGHTRLLAARKLGLDQVPVIRAEDLTEKQVKAFRIADNKTAEFSEWDDELLAMELEGLEDMFTGFSEDEIDALLGQDGPAGVVEDDYEIVPPEEPISKRGDLWLLGRHRLMCGDSTSADDVGKLMNGDKADMVFTDPPYNIDYSGVNDKRTIQNDKMNDEDFVDFLKKSLMVVDTAYVCCCWQNNHLFKKAMTELGMPPKAMIIWDKVNPAQNLDKYYKQYEIIFYYGRFGGEKTLRGDIWECKRQRNTVHPTMKPIELIAIALRDNPSKKIVYDGFGGSGSTLIACEQLNRICYMMELDEKYVDVIVNRYINFKESDEDVFLIRDGEKIPYSEAAPVQLLSPVSN